MQKLTNITVKIGFSLGEAHSLTMTIDPQVAGELFFKGCTRGPHL